MLRISANISTLFNELPLLDRPGAAASAGFAAVEVQFPYVVGGNDLAKGCSDAGVDMVLLNISAGRLDEGELGLACLPDRESDFRYAVEEAIAYALLLRCPMVNCLAGNIPADATRSACWEILVRNLRYAAARFETEGIRLLVEPLNRRDHPAFILAGIEEAAELLSDVAHPNLSLQYDAYHMRAAGEDWLGEIARHRGAIGHIQFSDFPGRHEPGSGDMDMAALFQTISASDYTGWTGAEYRPSGTTPESLGWFADLSNQFPSILRDSAQHANIA